MREGAGTRIIAHVAGDGEVCEIDKEVKRAKREVPEDPIVARIISRQNRHGHWGGARAIHTWWPKKDTTFWVLGVLADFGLSRGDRRIGRACEYMMGTQLPCGAFGWVLKDPRVLAMTEMLRSKQDEDGRFRPEPIHRSWSGLDFGQKKHPSRWITLLAYRAAGRTTGPLCRATGA